MADNSRQFEFDVALSFAGEDRATVEKFARLLDTRNIKYFYDEAESYDLWGKDLIAHLADVYENRARYCVMFISKHYPLKRWTSFDELIFKHAHFAILMSTSFQFAWIILKYLASLKQ